MRPMIAIAMFVWLSACGEGPREIYIDQRFDDHEMAEIEAAVREVNSLARLIEEDELVVITGRFSDRNGEFQQKNVDNERNELYRIGTSEECIDFVDQYSDSFGTIDNLYGFYTGTDIGVLVFNLWLPDRPPLRHVVMHELGHFVGMDHVINNRHAVMHPSAYSTDTFTEADKEQFCYQHGCGPH